MTKRVMHPRAVDTAFAKAFNLLGKMGPRELRDKMEEMGYKPGTGLFKELLKSRGKSRFKDGGSVRPIIKVDKDGRIRQTGKKRLKDGTISVQPEGGIKFIPNKKDGGLMEAIEKVKAKGMKEGGNVPKPKMRPKKDPFRADKTVIINEDFSKRVAKANEEAMKKAKKMAKGGMAGRKTPKPMRAMNKLDDAVEEFIETIEPFQGTVRKGEKLRNIDGKTMIIRQMPNPNFSGNTISDRDRAMVGAMLGEGGRMISDADRQMVSQMMGARRMEDGGVVPAKFKGFSKLPEDVQQKMNPTLAKKFKKGGPVKMGSGGGVCRGMGAARAGGKFKLR